MINEIETPRVRGFATNVLPWLLGAGMLAVFLAMLNRWVTPNNLNEVVDFAGWSQRPHTLGPVAFLATYPLRWMSAGMIPLALNLFSAVCAALTLGLLARSVALLPHDRTHEQRQREQSEFSVLTIPAAWLPPLLAVLVCGLQMTFWENATDASGEMFDLLLFAYVIRCLLEYRISGKESWLIRFALVYGLGMANNIAMIGFFPAFLAAVVWIKGAGALNPLFMSRMICCGLAGLLLIFLFPLMNKISHATPMGFWQYTRSIFSIDKRILTTFPRGVLAVLALTSILPVFVIGIRWASYFGDNSPLGIFIATSMFHIVHGMFLLACIWVALDSPVSPRQMGFGLSFLGFYYLGALSIGYLSGYFLLIFGVNKSKYGPHPIIRALSLCVVAGIWLLLIAVPLVMVRKNLPRLQTSRLISRSFENYFAQIEQLLPSKGTVVLSDDPFRLFYLQATLNRNGKQPPHLLLDTGALERETDYLKFQEKAHPGYQLSGPWMHVSSNAPTALASIQLFDHLSLDHSIYYLHPSFGYYFEKFYQEPHGLVYQLKSYPSNAWDAPLSTPGQIAENQTFWKGTFEGVLPPLLGMLEKLQTRTKAGPWEHFLESLHLKPEPDFLALPVGAYYSRSLNEWGVELQKAGLLAEAGKCFTQALQLNSNNVSADINQVFNKKLLTGQKPSVQIVKDLEGTILGPFNGWLSVLKSSGPIDEPSYRDDLGSMLATNGDYRQAVQQFNRVKTFVPDDIHAPLQLAQLFIYIQTYTNGLSQFLPWTECYANALQNTEQVLKAHPDEPNALFLQSVALLQLKSYDGAVQSLDQLLSLPSQTNNYAAVLNRAIAHYKVGNFKAARQDYAAVGRVAPKAFQVYYGLGEIAYEQKDKPEAIKNYELYLTNAPPNTEEARSVTARLKELRTGAP